MVAVFCGLRAASCQWSVVDEAVFGFVPAACVCTGGFSFLCFMRRRLRAKPQRGACLRNKWKPNRRQRKTMGQGCSPDTVEGCTSMVCRHRRNAFITIYYQMWSWQPKPSSYPKVWKYPNLRKNAKNPHYAAPAVENVHRKNLGKHLDLQAASGLTLG